MSSELVNNGSSDGLDGSGYDADKAVLLSSISVDVGETVEGCGISYKLPIRAIRREVRALALLLCTCCDHVNRLAVLCFSSVEEGEEDSSS